MVFSQSRKVGFGWSKAFAIFLVLAGGFFVFGAGEAKAATYTVCSSGCDSTTIQGIFTGKDLEPDDIVEVRADIEGGSKIYREAVSWGSDDDGTNGHSVILRGRTGDVITLHGDSDENGIDDLATLIDINNVNFIEVQNLILTHPTTDGIQIRGTSNGIVVRNVTATYSGNQGFQMEDTASATFYDLVGNNNVDDGFSMHDSTTAVINVGSFDRNADGINHIGNSTITAVDVIITDSSSEAICSTDVGSDGTITAIFTNVTIDQANGAFTDNVIYVTGTNVMATITDLTISNVPVGTSAQIIRVDDGAELNLIDVAVNGNASDDANGIIGNAAGSVLNISGADINNVKLGVVLSNTAATISNSTIHNTTTTGYGIFVMAGSTLNLTNSEIYSTTYAIYDQGMSGLMITRNYFYNNSNQFIELLTSGETVNIYNNIFSGIANTKFAVSCRTGTTCNAYNNTIYDSDTNGKGFYVDGTATVTNNIFTWLAAGIHTTANTDLTASYNVMFGNTADWAGYSGSQTNGISSDPLFINAGTDFGLQSTSLAIDTGTNVGLTTDYAGNPIYGPPDIGAYEYQPPYEMGTDEVDLVANARVYGDGKFRNTQTPGGTTADLTVDPASNDTSEYLDIEISNWNTSEKQWTESSTTITGNVAHTIGDLEAGKYYNVTSDDSIVGLTSASCDSVDSNFVCQADQNGQIQFTWTGGYSTHTFNVSEGDNIEPTVTNGTTAKFHTDTTLVNLSLTTSENSICKYSSENTAYDNMTDFTTTGETSHSTEITNLTPGNYTYYAICRDNVGNDTNHVLTFEIASEEEETNINNAKLKKDNNNQKLSDDKKIYYDQKETKLKGEDSTIANGKVKIYKEGKRISTVDADEDGKWSKEISFKRNKTYTLKLKFYDRYGTLKNTKEYDVKIDTEKPIFTNPLPISKSIVRDEKVTFTATDENSGMDFYKVKLVNENGRIKRSWQDQNEGWYKIPKVVENGTYVLMVRAYDKAGNYAEQQMTISVRENQDTKTQESENQSTSTSSENVTPNACSYTIQQDDTLWNIAKKVYGDATEYQRIIDLNPDLNLDALKIGQELKLCGNDQTQQNKQSDSSSQSQNQQTQPQPQAEIQTQPEPETPRWWNPFSWF